MKEEKGGKVQRKKKAAEKGDYEEEEIDSGERGMRGEKNEKVQRKIGEEKGEIGGKEKI